MNIPGYELEVLLTFASKHALGHSSSGVVKTITGIIEDNKGCMSDTARQITAREIRKALEEDQAGSKEDRSHWEHLLEVL